MSCAKWVYGSFAVSLLLICSARGGSLPGAPNCPMFPANNVWNADISALPVDTNSSNYLANMATGTGLHPDFGSFAGFGIPYNVVSSAQAKVSVDFSAGAPTESDNGPYPIPANPNIESNDLAACSSPNGNGDCHILIVDKDACILYELDAAATQGPGQWTAFSGAIWSLKSNALRTDTWTSADAAGLPILPGLVRYDEVAAGLINHALRFTMVHTQQAHIYPARHDASSNTGAFVPPMGLRVRLKAGANLSGLSPQALVIAHAMQKYGLILADNGSNWFISGASDPNFDDTDLHTLGQLHGSDFEVVDTSGLRNGPDSFTATVNVGQSGSNFVDTVSHNSTTTIPANTTVVWTWVGSNHSTTSGSCPGNVCTADGRWDSQVNSFGNTFMQVFNQVGTYPYFCSVHLSMMQGTVIVGVPDYALANSNSPQTVFAGQTATFNGTLTSIFGYNSPVNLSCGAGHPATCTLAPVSQTPTAPGASFTVTAGDPTTNDFTFGVQGAGTDAAQTAHAQSVTLHVVDFALTAPSPGSVTMADGNTSPPIAFSLNPMGSFNYPVTLNCAGLPANTSCAFNNQAAPVTVTPSGGPLPVNMTLTSNGATPNTYAINITAASVPARPGGALLRLFSLTINAPSGSTDLSLADGAVETPPQAHEVGKPLVFTFTAQNSGASAAGTIVSVTSASGIVQSVSSAHASPNSCPIANNVATCNLGTMANPDSASITVTLVPRLARTATVAATIGSNASDTTLNNNVLSITRQVRFKPLARRGLIPRVP